MHIYKRCICAVEAVRRVAVLEKSLMSNRYLLYKYIKMIYALMVKTNECINAEVQSNL